MTHLRKRMIEDLQLRGLGALTQHRYVRAVQQLAEHYGKSPDIITEEELRDYFLIFAFPVNALVRSQSASLHARHGTMEQNLASLLRDTITLPFYPPKQCI